MTPLRALAALSIAATLAGCASLSQPITDGLPDAGRECAQWFAVLDRAVASAGVRDAQAAQVAGFPHLRVSRLLASYRDEAVTPAQWDAWLTRLREADQDARQFELANLPAAGRWQLLERAGIGERDASSERQVSQLLQRSASCGNELLAADRAAGARSRAIRERARIADAYSTVARGLGIYPLTKLAFAAGVARWQAETVRAFEWQRSATGAPRLRYVPRSVPRGGDATSALLASRTRDTLGIVRLTEEVRERLLEEYAPVIEIVGAPPAGAAPGADRFGAIEIDPAGTVQVAPANPLIYGRVEHTRIGNETMLQLVYAFWFPERAAESSFDPLAGRLDGVVWRVTLAADGTPLVFDSIHACGCYHMFFPTARVRERERPAELGADDEWLFMPRAPLRAAARPTLQLRAGTHDLVGVLDDGTPVADAGSIAAALGAGAVGYRFAGDDALRSVPMPTGAGDPQRRSLFGSDGLVAGSERVERWYFWPMGIASTGAMRQWGGHATAFVGRRHFDDPRLIDARFKIVAGNR